jgi:hypothetical protein
LRQHCDELFVVLNKIDEWDDLDPTVVDDVVNQWKNDLKVDKIYPLVRRVTILKAVIPDGY